MFKRRIAAVAVIALATISSTSLVGFASKNIASNAKGVLKVVAESNNTPSNSVNTNATPKPVSTSTTTNPVSTNVTKPKLLDISDAQAIQTAKDGIKYYGDIDLDKIINEYNLTSKIDKCSGYGRTDPTIDVYFCNAANDSKTPYLFGADISLVTGKVNNINIYSPDNELNSIPVDYSKVKEATIKFLKDKGFGTNYESMVLGGDKVSAGINGSVTEYADGTQVSLEFSNKNYTLFNFCLYNLKTDKIEPTDKTYYPITVK